MHGVYIYDSSFPFSKFQNALHASPACLFVTEAVKELVCLNIRETTDSARMWGVVGRNRIRSKFSKCTCPDVVLPVKLSLPDPAFYGGLVNLQIWTDKPKNALLNYSRRKYILLKSDTKLFIFWKMTESREAPNQSEYILPEGVGKTEVGPRMPVGTNWQFGSWRYS